MATGKTGVALIGSGAFFSILSCNYEHLLQPFLYSESAQKTPLYFICQAVVSSMSRLVKILNFLKCEPIFLLLAL
ncbi:hypothetical protein BU16DRAFT_531389 [Lophium mytilinum]|uniref:Uncharacterized protein n=1 Tax=Lophium mytilinum TaxID=390894 RepID=A0A6A6QEX9_9PEZI|nr:hypothetical protein BU16DRAFT_531389 [Lophium mytilinum]